MSSHKLFLRRHSSSQKLFLDHQLRNLGNEIDDIKFQPAIIALTNKSMPVGPDIPGALIASIFVIRLWAQRRIPVRPLAQLRAADKMAREVDGLGSIRCFAGVAKGLGDVRRIRKGRCRPALCIRGLAQRGPSAVFPDRPYGKADLSEPSTSSSLPACSAFATRNSS